LRPHIHQSGDDKHRQCAPPNPAKAEGGGIEEGPRDVLKPLLAQEGDQQKPQGRHAADPDRSGENVEPDGEEVERLGRHSGKRNWKAKQIADRKNNTDYFVLIRCRRRVPLEESMRTRLCRE